jgi:hypothetical protein
VTRQLFIAFERAEGVVIIVKNGDLHHATPVMVMAVTGWNQTFIVMSDKLFEHVKAPGAIAGQLSLALFADIYRLRKTSSAS